MLRSLGMGDALEAAKQLATNGTIQKIVAFADGIGELNARLERIERMLTAGSYTGNSRPDDVRLTHDEGSSTLGTSDRRSIDVGATGFSIDDGHIGDIQHVEGV